MPKQWGRLPAGIHTSPAFNSRRQAIVWVQ